MGKDIWAKLYTSLYLRLAAIIVAVGVLLRVILLFNPETLSTDFSALQWIEIFGLGAINDLCVATLGYVFVWIYLVTAGEWKFRKPTGYIILGLILAALLYELLNRHSILNDYGSVVPLIVKLILGTWAICFGIKLFVPNVRNRWRTVWFTILMFIYSAVIILNAVGEYYFWSEFGVRYNFIAVDYLMYTNEVIANIFESYPMLPLTLVTILCGAAMTWLFMFRQTKRLESTQSAKTRVTAAIAFPVAFAVSVLVLSLTARVQHSDNTYSNELQANGGYKFYEAFVSNELRYDKFYTQIDDAEMNAIITANYGQGVKMERRAAPVSDTLKGRNIVLITVESLSADYMGFYGDTKNTTPCLDSLYRLGMRFNNLFATGNRTVRGLEAVTLSLPPSPGQSIVKRKRNTGYCSTAEILRQNGYQTLFFYGGDSYFDNMRSFFGGNGYHIVDKADYTAADITFSNAWGVCDEDSFNKALQVLDADTLHKPFFAHIMTISNHRPFTYPEGRIDISANAKSRRGGVKYSDYALGKFISDASHEPWFANTVFVITADHCASSAGKTDLPLDKYRIPALIYAPGAIASQDVNKVCSQIDLMPTLFAMMGIDYNASWYGRNVLDNGFKPRAYVATYQDLGYYADDTLTVLSPVRRIEQFVVRNKGNEYDEQPVKNANQHHAHRAIADYQSSAEWYVDL